MHAYAIICRCVLTFSFSWPILQVPCYLLTKINLFLFHSIVSFFNLVYYIFFKLNNTWLEISKNRDILKKDALALLSEVKSGK